MKKVTITWSAALTFLANLSGVISLIQLLFNIKITKMSNSDIAMKVFSIVVTFILVYYLLSQIFSLKRNLELHFIINQIRDGINFEEQHQNIKFISLHNESLEVFLDKSLPDIYERKLQIEIKAVRYAAIDKFKDLTTGQIDKMIIKVYGIKEGKPELTY